MQSDKLQVPKVKEICANKKYFDVLYSYLQCISVRDEENDIRYFTKKDVNFSKLAVEFGLTRQTISTRFKYLKELGMIKKIDEKTYELIELENKAAMLIPYKTLRVLTDALSENSISTYTFLFNEYYKNGYKPFQFSLEQIKGHIGICTSTRSNDEIVTNILFVLQRLGLIKCSLSTRKQEEDVFANIKTIYQLDWVTTKLS